MDIDENAKNLNVGRLENLTKIIREYCNCEVLLFNVKYVSSERRLLRETVRAQFLFINHTNDALILADRAISIIDKNAINSKGLLPKLSEFSKQTIEVTKLFEIVPHARLREAALLFAIFTFLLFSVLIVFAIILCYHRSKFLHEKKMYDDAKIAAGSMNKINRHKQPLAYMKSVQNNLREKYPNAIDEKMYVVQEVKILVGLDDSMKRIRDVNND